MNLTSTAPLWIVVPLILLLVAAAVEDALRLRISNWTSIGVLLLAVVAAIVGGPTLNLWQNALVFALLLIGGTVIFAAGKIGGGDVKLLAALGAWVSLKGALGLITTVFLVGGLLAIGFIVARVVKRRNSKAGIPYGIAIVVGSLLTFAAHRGLI